MWKRLSNGEIMDLSEPVYIQWDGLMGYIVESHGEIYHFYAMEGDIIKTRVTKYFERI